MKAANNAPFYACMYAELAEIARSYGYALAIHGSMGRDFDLIAVPWTEDAAEPETVIAGVLTRWGGKLCGEATAMPHGRRVWTVAIMFGEVFLDFGFMPKVPTCL